MDHPPETLKEWFSYNPNTGDIHWIKSPGHKTPKGKIAGTVNAKGYRIINLRGKLMRGHRIAWALHYGSLPSKFIDHINGIKDDNRIENLREATSSQNNSHRGPRKDTASGHRNVYRSRNGWRVSVVKDGKRHQKYFGELQAAVDYAETKRDELFGEFSGKLREDT